MYKECQVTAILLMGGTGMRFGSALPKQLHRLAGKKIYLHTLEAFLSLESFDEIILVCHKDWVQEVQNDIAQMDAAKVKIISGGSTRQESSYLGLKACRPNTDIAVIHDAVRPFVSQEILKNNIEGAYLYHAVDTCIPSADTIVHSSDATSIATIPNRSEYLRGQTPQSFYYPLIVKAHQNTKQKNASDDCRLVLEAGATLHIVQGSEDNIKITTELDIFLAEQIFRLRKQNPSLKENKHSLAGKRFAVVGGTGGIGTWICNLLEKEKAIPVVISRSAPKFAADLTIKSSIKDVFKKIHDEYGHLDGLINAAGLLKIKPFDILKVSEIEELLAVNFTGLLYVLKAVKIKEGGHIINIASSSFSRGRKDYGIYSSAKAAIVNLTQSLAEERQDLHINVIVPQRTNTPMRLANFPGERTEDLLHPKMVAEAAITLLKNEKITGSIVEVRQ